jgi:hypothetical protein
MQASGHYDAPANNSFNHTDPFCLSVILPLCDPPSSVHSGLQTLLTAKNGESLLWQELRQFMVMHPVLTQSGKSAPQGIAGCCSSWYFLVELFSTRVCNEQKCTERSFWKAITPGMNLIDSCQPDYSVRR